MSARTGLSPKQKKLKFSAQGLPSLAPASSQAHKNPGQSRSWVHAHFTPVPGNSTKARCNSSSCESESEPEPESEQSDASP